MWLRFWSFLDRIFFGPASVGQGPLPTFVRIMRYVYAVVRDLSRGQINLRAMGLVFTTLLSLIPLLAFSFAILKVFGAHRDLEPIVYEFFKPVGATAPELTTRVMQFADRVSSGVVGSVGFALLLWTLLGTIKKVEDSFNFLWRVEQPRSFARRVAEYLSLLIIGPILLVGFIGLTHATLGSQPFQRIAGLPFLQQLTASGIKLAPYVMVTAFFTVLYMFIPNTRVQVRSALIGALAAGVIWAAVGKMFTGMVVLSTRLTIVYAGFAVIVAVLLWTYFGWLILLAGAQLSFYVQNPSYLQLGLEELRLSSNELEQLALKVMYLVGKSHTSGGKRWTVNGLARELGLPGIAIAQISSTLEKSGLLIVTEDDEFTPGRDISRISLREILEAARNQRSGHFAPQGIQVPAVERLTAKLDDAWRDCCANRTLRDLLEES
jgi:membrane protein